MRSKIQNNSTEIYYSWRDHRHLSCIGEYGLAVVLNFMDTSFLHLIQPTVLPAFPKDGAFCFLFH